MADKEGIHSQEFDGDGFSKLWPAALNLYDRGLLEESLAALDRLLGLELSPVRRGCALAQKAITLLGVSGSTQQRASVSEEGLSLLIRQPVSVDVSQAIAQCLHTLGYSMEAAHTDRKKALSTLAIQASEHLLADSAGASDPVAVFRAYGSTASIVSFTEDWEKAFYWQRHALEQPLDLAPAEEVVDSLLWFASRLRSLRRVEEARQVIARAEEVFKKRGKKIKVDHAVLERELLFESGQIAYLAGDYSAAVRYLSQLVPKFPADTPDYWESLKTLALAEGRLGNHEKAIEILRNILNTTSSIHARQWAEEGMQAARYGKAFNDYKSKRYDAAIQEWESLLQEKLLNPDHPTNIRVMLSRCFEAPQIARYQDAAGILDQAVALATPERVGLARKDRIQFRIRKGTREYNAGDYAPAIQEFESLLKQVQDDETNGDELRATIQFTLGHCYYKTAQHPRALACYEAVLASDFSSEQQREIAKQGVAFTGGPSRPGA